MTFNPKAKDAIAHGLGQGYKVLSGCLEWRHPGEEIRTAIRVKDPRGSVEKLFLRQRVGKDALMMAEAEFESLMMIYSVEDSIGLSPTPKCWGSYKSEEVTVAFNVNEWVTCKNADPVQRAVKLLDFHRSSLTAKQKFGFPYPTFLKNCVQPVAWQKTWIHLLKRLADDAVSVQIERYGQWEDEAWFRTMHHSLADILIAPPDVKPALTMGNVHIKLAAARFFKPGPLYAHWEWDWCFLCDYSEDLNEEQAAEIRQHALLWADEPKPQWADRAQLYLALKTLRARDGSHRSK